MEPQQNLDHRSRPHGEWEGIHTEVKGTRATISAYGIKEDFGSIVKDSWMFDDKGLKSCIY
jgi:hypothetical protein